MVARVRDGENSGFKMGVPVLILSGVSFVVVFVRVRVWQGLFVLLWLDRDKHRKHFTPKLLRLVLEDSLILKDK